MKKMNKGVFGVDIDVMYHCVYDLHETRDCREAGCEDEGICRCGVIDEVEFERGVLLDGTEIRMFRFEKDTTEYTPSEIERYCINRICRHYRLDDVSLFEADISGGYYGQEIDGIYHENEDAVCNSVLAIFNMATDIEKIHYILELEYGSVLEQLTACNEVTITSHMPELVLADGTHTRNIKSDPSLYEGSVVMSGFPIGILWEKPNGRIKLIDGHHRTISKIMLGEEKLQKYVTLK